VCCQAALSRPADCGGVAVCPGAFHERATSLAVAGFRDRTLYVRILFQITTETSSSTTSGSSGASEGSARRGLSAV
jgi:hypothetical protein